MQQIADWLQKLGMSEYAQRFAENGIDLSVLPDLTDQDLKDIGVLLGHRRKLLRAIAELNNAATTVAPAPPLVSAPIPLCCCRRSLRQLKPPASAATSR
jgi:SAM domain (Sterile alpha motif)